MSIEAITWDEGYGALPQMRYLHPQKVKQDVEQVRRAFGDLEPYVAQLPTGEVLFLMKGTLAPRTPTCCAVNFVITLQPPYPNSYPILTIEEPEAPWRFANHPHVDTSGQTYLASVSSWNPQRGTLFQCVTELQACCRQKPVFENTENPAVASRAAPPPAQPLPPPQPQPQPVPVQQPVRQPVPVQQPVRQPVPVQQPVRQQPVQQQQVVYGNQPVQRQHGQQGYNEYDAMRAVAKGTIAVAGMTMSLMGAGARALSNDPAVRPGNRAQPWEPPQPRGTPQQQRQERMKQDFVLLMQGKLNVPPGTEIFTPEGFCIGRFMTSRNAIDDGLLAPGPVPLPLPPCTDPTPKDAVEIAKQRERDDQMRAEATAQADTTSGMGWKALSAVGRFAGKAASKAKHSVEDRVRESSASKDLAKFGVDFPEDAKTQQLIIEYSCYALSGDAVMRKGRMYITQRNVFFSGAFNPPSAAGADPNIPPPEPVPFRFGLPFTQLVSILKGEGCGKKFLHLVRDDGTFRCFTDFSASTAGKVGSWVSTSMAGTDAYDRAYNWLDHTWRAATQVPSATYLYAGQPGPIGQLPGAPQQPLPGAPQQPPQTASGPGGVYAKPPPPTSPSTAAGFGAPSATPTAVAPGVTPDIDSKPAPSDSAQCVVCMEAQKNAFFQPCGHVCCCVKCANQLSTCPMCRAQIMQVFPAFL